MDPMARGTEGRKLQGWPETEKISNLDPRDTLTGVRTLTPSDMPVEFRLSAAWVTKGNTRTRPH